MNIYRGKTHTEVYLASILYDSIEDQDISAIKKLLEEKHADPNIILPKKGISCFHLAIGNDSAKFAMEVTLLIIQNGGDPNVLSDEGLTPVHIAAAWGRVDLLRILLNCGGDPQITDNCYKSALQYAVDENWEEAATLIKDFIDQQRLSVYSSYFAEIPYTILLDKLLLNNGHFIGEYELSKEETNVKSQMDLSTLPKTNTQEYVLNWCNNQKLQSDSAELTQMCNLDLPNNKYCDNTSFIDSENSSLSYKNYCIQQNYKNDPLNCYIPNSQSFAEVRENCTPEKFDKITLRKKTKIYNTLISKDVCKYKESSRESGITSLRDSSEEEPVRDNCLCYPTEILTEIVNISLKENKDTSSDYYTCTDGSESVNILDKATYEFPINTTVKSTLSNDDQELISVSEIYKYIDTKENIVLYEKRILTSSTKGSQNGSLNTTSSLSSLPTSFSYDTDTLRNELTSRGFDPGPITKTTKRVYLKKLYQLKKQSHIPHNPRTNQKVYSSELQKTLKDVDWHQDLTEYQRLEDLLKNQFTHVDTSRKWREGTAKTSFTYLLLDPRVTHNLPHRCEQLEKYEVWETFLSAIFYVGKGKRSRPYSHFYAALSNYNKPELITDSKKINRILDIWKDDNGVVCLHIFQNVIPVEAYTREAAMINALKLENITNVKVGDFYGVTTAWSQKQKNLLGVYLLYRAMKIFLNEGERQLFPNDIEHF